MCRVRCTGVRVLAAVSPPAASAAKCVVPPAAACQASQSRLPPWPPARLPAHRAGAAPTTAARVGTHPKLPHQHPPLPRAHPSLEPSSLRPAGLPVPVVKLGAEFQRLEEYERRFKGPLDVRELEHLTVAGDVVFGANMVLKVSERRCPALKRGSGHRTAGSHSPSPAHPCSPQGTVIIVANEGQRIELPPGCILEDKVVTGNLRIMEH